jgi:hypothetical protein
MSDFCKAIATLRRPRLLVRAARLGLGDYRRERDLRRLIGDTAAPEAALPRLMDEEERLDQSRRRGDATYPVTRHIEVLIALMAELRMFPAREA